MDIREALEDWVIKQAVDKYLNPEIAAGRIHADQKAVVEQAAVDIANDLLAQFAAKKGLV